MSPWLDTELDGGETEEMRRNEVAPKYPQVTDVFHDYVIDTEMQVRQAIGLRPWAAAPDTPDGRPLESRLSSSVGQWHTVSIIRRNYIIIHCLLSSGLMRS